MRMSKVLSMLFCLAVSLSMNAYQYYSKDYFYSLDFSDQWSLKSDSKKYNVSFTSKGNEAMVEVFVYETSSIESSTQIYQLFADRFHLDGEGDATVFCQYEALRGVHDFRYKGNAFKIELVVFHDDYYYYLIMGYTSKRGYESYREEISAAIDSFKIYYDNGIIFSNENEGGRSEFASQTVKNEKAEEKKKDFTGELYELSLSWSEYRGESFSFNKDDLQISINELSAMMSPDCWSYFNIDYNSDPDYHFTLWTKFYQEVYDKNYYRITPMVEWFEKEAGEQNWTPYELANHVMKSIQGIPYERPHNIIQDKENGSNLFDYFTPNQIAWYQKGDCDTKSMLIVLILKRLGFDALIYFSEKYGHAMAGLHINGSGEYKEWDGKKYYFIESTYPGWSIGDLPPQMGNKKHWRIIPIR